MYSKLEPLAVEILEPTGFYERYDLDIPEVIEGRRLGIEEKDAIERIATALTIAADAAHRTPPGIVRAWLDRIAQNPALFRSEQLPPEVHWQIASCYRRGSERPGTHLQDVWGRRRVRFETRARRATLPRIAQAAVLPLRPWDDHMAARSTSQIMFWPNTSRTPFDGAAAESCAAKLRAIEREAGFVMSKSDPFTNSSKW